MQIKFPITAIVLPCFCIAEESAIVSTPSAKPLTTVIPVSTKKSTIFFVRLFPKSDTFLEPTTETLRPFSNKEKSPL